MSDVILKDVSFFVPIFRIVLTTFVRFAFLLQGFQNDVGTNLKLVSIRSFLTIYIKNL